MKNYLLFAGRDFYPVGGADDFHLGAGAAGGLQQ
jgi:hypothetical protein